MSLDGEFTSGTGYGSKKPGGTLVYGGGQWQIPKGNTVAPPSTQNKQSSKSYYNPQADYMAAQQKMYDELLRKIEEQKELQKQKTIATIRNQVEQAVNAYNGKLGELDGTYQPLKNQSEVERYNAMKSLREAQANRGALDSGAGRQETLNMDTSYGNRLNTISLQQQNETDAINRAIMDTKSQGELQIANAGTDADLSALGNTFDIIRQQLADQQAMSLANAKKAASSSGGGSAKSSSGLSSSGQSFYNNMKLMNLQSDQDIVKAIQSGLSQGQLTATDLQYLSDKYGMVFTMS